MYSISSNFGDNLNKYLLKDMIDGKVNFFHGGGIKREKNISKIEWDEQNIKKLNEVAKSDGIFIGSILHIISNWTYFFHENSNKYKAIVSYLFFKIIDYFNPLIIYGAGFPIYYKKESYVRNIKVLAVRGKVTLERFKRNGIKCENNVVLADPGILSLMLLNITDISKLNSSKEYDLCIIPHFLDKSNKYIKNNIQINNSITLNIDSQPNEFLKSLMKCKNALSSSLHGLIISDTLGIPNMRMIVRDNIWGGDYKFIDYYSAYSLKFQKKIDLRRTIFSGKHLKYLNQFPTIPQNLIKKKQCQLLKNFPFKLKKKYLLIKEIFQ